MVAKQEKVLSQQILLPGLLDWIDFGDKWGNLKVEGLWLRSWTPYYQIQTEIEESRENHFFPLWLYSGSEK